MQKVSRRSFLTGVSTAAAGLWLGGCSPKTPAPTFLPRKTTPGGKPGRIIHLVSDGMSIGVLQLAENYSRAFRNRETHWGKLMREPLGDTHQGLMDMASASSSVTDSAAASSSWGCGHRINNGSINVGPDGSRLEPILVTAMKHGWAGGLVTTAALTHATPAGFLAQVDSRDEAEIIADQYLARAIQVYLGGGSPHFDPAQRKDGKDLFAAFSRKGYQVVRDRTQLLNWKSDRPILGTFATGHLPYTVDQINQPLLQRDVPTLSEMTDAALKRLAALDCGFLLQVEGSRIDHAAHANDTPALVLDQIAFDDALGVALEFQKNHPDTLLVVTTDHGNASPSLNGHGNGYNGSDAMFAKVGNMKGSYSSIAEAWNADMSVGQLCKLVFDSAQIEIEATEARVLQEAIRTRGLNPYLAQSESAIHTLASILANYTAVGWAGISHTSDYVVLTAQGPGASSLPGFLRNTDLNVFYRQCMASD